MNLRNSPWIVRGFVTAMVVGLNGLGIGLLKSEPSPSEFVNLCVTDQVVGSLGGHSTRASRFFDATSDAPQPDDTFDVYLGGSRPYVVTRPRYNACRAATDKMASTRSDIIGQNVDDKLFLVFVDVATLVAGVERMCELMYEPEDRISTKIFRAFRNGQENPEQHVEVAERDAWARTADVSDSLGVSPISEDLWASFAVPSVPDDVISREPLSIV